jgi:hypothetical protein
MNNGWRALNDFLQTDPGDVGCAEAMEMLHVYAELVAGGEPAEQCYPGVAGHLRACGPCGEDFEGLLAAMRDTLGLPVRVICRRRPPAPGGGAGPRRAPAPSARPQDVNLLATADISPGQ